MRLKLVFAASSEGKGSKGHLQSSKLLPVPRSQSSSSTAAIIASSVADLSAANITWEILQTFSTLLVLQVTVAMVEACEQSYHLLTLIAQCSLYLLQDVQSVYPSTP